MSTPDITIGGLTSAIPGAGGAGGAGYVLGRTKSGTGPAHLISIDDLATATSQRGASSSSGSSLGSSGVTPGSYTNTNLTVNAQGLITAASNGTAGGSGALSLISTLTASSSADLHWTGLASQTGWRLVGRLIVPATTSHGIGLQIGTGAGPTYITTGYHVMVTGRTDSNASVSGGALSNANVSFDVGDTKNSNPGNSFDVTILTDNASFLTIMGTGMYLNNAGNYVATAIGASIAIAAAITALKIIDDHGGNLSTGNASLYSLSH